MAHYLVTGLPREELLPELGASSLATSSSASGRSGKALSFAEERAAVLDRYFDDLSTEPDVEGTGWALIDALPAMFPDLTGR